MATEEKSTKATTTATKTTTADTTNTATATSKTKNSAKESTFKKDNFIKNAKALGYERYIVVGAFSNCDKDELTKSEFESLIKNFLGKKVK